MGGGKEWEEGRNGRREGGGGKQWEEGRRGKGGRKERGKGGVGGEREKDRWEGLREKGVSKGEVERQTAGLFVCEHIDWRLSFVRQKLLSPEDSFEDEQVEALRRDNLR